MADLPSILGGMAQGFVDFGKGVVDMFGTGGAAIGDLIEGARTGKVTTKNQDDFRKWLYQTDSTKDAAAKGLGTTLNGVQTVLDYIPGVNVLTRNPLGNAAQGALGGLADEFKTYGEDYDLGRAGQRAAVSGAAAAASGSLADALKGSSNALLSSNTLQGLARGATGGAITGGGYAAIDGGDVLEAAKQGAGMGALIGGATGAFQDFKPAKTYAVALTDDERAARIANAQKQIDDIGPIRRFTDDPNELAKRARVNELQDAIKAYQSGYDTVQDYNDALAARRANRQPSLTREEYEAKMQQRIRDLGGNYEVTPEKQAQFDRLQKVNPMRDDYHTGIRAPQDIATLQEAINNAKDIDPAYKAMLQKALADDSVTVYSSYPIEEGVFTTPIKQMAQDYAGPGNQVYSKTISPNDIAWIDDQEGNYIPRLQQLETTLSDADMAVNNPRYLTDENGNPRTFYHGTPKNPTESGDTLGSGLYITSNKDRATGYANGGDVSSYDTSGLNIANLDDVIPENVAKVLRDNPELSDKLKTLTPTTETYDLAQRDAAYNRFKALKGEYPRDLIEVKKTNSGFDISYPGDVDYTKITGKDLFRKLNTPDAQDVFMRAGYDGVSKTALGGDTEMAIYRNAPQPLESTLSDADMAVNSPKLTPEQEAYFKDSVIRDENGKLMRVYHSSPNKFTTFDDSRLGSNTAYDNTAFGHFVTSDEDFSRRFRNIDGNTDEGYTMELYANAKKPITHPYEAAYKYSGDELDNIVKNYYKETGNTEALAAIKEWADESGQSLYDAYMDMTVDENPFETAAADRQTLQGKGYDAVEFVEGRKSGLVDGSTDNTPISSYAIFSGNQLKDINNLKPTDAPSIMESRIAPEELDLARALSDQDLLVNNAKIAPGQLGLFDDMPTQTPKTGTRQTSLFDQPDNPYLDYYSGDIDTMPLTPEAPANPYAPVDGKLTQAMKDRYWELMSDANQFKYTGADNDLYNKINPETLPKGYKELQHLLDTQDTQENMVEGVLKNKVGTDNVWQADTDKLLDYVWGGDNHEKKMYYKTLEDEIARAKKNAVALGLDNYNAEEELTKAKRQDLQLKAYKKAELEALDKVIQVSDTDDIMHALSNYNRRGIRTGDAGALDTVLSERLGIAPGNTIKITKNVGGDLSKSAAGRYARNARDIAVSDINSPEGKVSTMAHERLHSFQNEARPESAGRYDPEVVEAYKQLQKDLGHYYKSNSEIKKRYKRDVDYWASSGEQESRMFQQYLENKGYTDNSAWRKMGGKADEWGNEINPAFDKFIDKLRDLSKRGVALPALAALFGGGAYMASQENDKEKEVK